MLLFTPLIKSDQLNHGFCVEKCTSHLEADSL